MSEIENDEESLKPIKTGTSDSVLASLFRSILFDLNVNIPKFNHLLSRYFINRNIKTNTDTINSLRGNLKKELLKDSMSWKVFIKGLSFLSIKKFELEIKLHHSNNLITKHTKIVIIDDFNEEE
jgi:hypothetical protein